ncbi:MAG: hypothetical protein GEU79_18285 [Acidimicrobiia bacterium]|nr:hypothetical protein [Acidimicrobiia bacterium]
MYDLMQVKALIGDEFLDLVGDPATVPYGILNVLDRYIPSFESRIHFIDLDRSTMQAWQKPELEMSNEVLERSSMKLISTHPIFQYYQENHVFGPIRLSDLVDIEEFAKTAIYQKYYQEKGVSDQLSARLEGPYGNLIVIDLTRIDGLFTDEEVQTLAMVRKTIDHVVRQARFGIRHEATLTALSGRKWNGVVVDDVGMVRSTYMGKIEGAEVGKPLPSEVLGVFLDWVSNPKPRPLVCLGLEGAVRITEISNGENLLMYRPPSDAKHAFLRELGLTQRQADTAMALHRGGTNYQIARQLGISESTVKKHLERVYAILHVDNRAAAVGSISDLDTTRAP